MSQIFTELRNMDPHEESEVVSVKIYKRLQSWLPRSLIPVWRSAFFPSGSPSRSDGHGTALMPPRVLFPFLCSFTVELLATSWLVQNLRFRLFRTGESHLPGVPKLSPRALESSACNRFALPTLSVSKLVTEKLPGELTAQTYSSPS